MCKYFQVIITNKERRIILDKLYTCAEIADRYSVPIGTVWLWIRDKKFPAIKIGKGYRVAEADLRKFEAERRTV